MTPATVLFIIALVLALIEEFRAKGQSLVAWAVVLVAVGLTMGKLG